MTTKTKKADAAKNDATSKVAEGAREAVKRTTATAKERTDSLYSSTVKYNADLEDVLVRAARGYVSILGNIAEAVYANANHTIATAEKLAEAKSVSDALKIQADFVREQSTTNMENARSAFEYVRGVVVENGEALRENATSYFNAARDKAAA